MRACVTGRALHSGAYLGCPLTPMFWQHRAGVPVAFPCTRRLPWPPWLWASMYWVSPRSHTHTHPWQKFPDPSRCGRTSCPSVSRALVSAPLLQLCSHPQLSRRPLTAGSSAVGRTDLSISKHEGACPPPQAHSMGPCLGLLGKWLRWRRTTPSDQHGGFGGPTCLPG